jgi:hypothetical protein
MGEITRQMSLLKQLSQKKSGIVKKWFDGIIATYPVDTAQFLGSQKDPFANPVGQTTRENLVAIFDQIVSAADPDTVREFLDPIIRIRAIQDFTPAKALSWIFDLKDIIRDTLALHAGDEQHLDELSRLERRIDQFGLLAFDIYMQCREKIYDLKANEMRARTFSAFSRAGLIKDPVDNDSPAK